MPNTNPSYTHLMPPRRAGRPLPPPPQFPDRTRLMLQCLYGLQKPLLKPRDAKVRAAVVGLDVPRS